MHQFFENSIGNFPNINHTRVSTRVGSERVIEQFFLIDYRFDGDDRKISFIREITGVAVTFLTSP
jgi:hypothetical protein